MRGERSTSDGDSLSVRLGELSRFRLRAIHDSSVPKCLWMNGTPETGWLHHHSAPKVANINNNNSSTSDDIATAHAPNPIDKCVIIPFCSQNCSQLLSSSCICWRRTSQKPLFLRSTGQMTSQLLRAKCFSFVLALRARQNYYFGTKKNFPDFHLNATHNIRFFCIFVDQLETKLRMNEIIGMMSFHGKKCFFFFKLW